MTEQLSPLQEDQISKCRDKWLEKGLSTNPIDREKITGTIREFYQVILGRRTREVPVIFTRGPFEAWVCTILAHMMIGGVRDSSSSLHREMFVGKNYMHLIDGRTLGWNERGDINRVLGRDARLFTDIRLAVAGVVYDEEIRKILYDDHTLKNMIDDCVEILSPYIKNASDFPIKVFMNDVREYILSFSFAANGLGQFAIEDLAVFEVSKIMEVKRNNEISFTCCNGKALPFSDADTLVNSLSNLTEASFIFPLKKVCLVSERPTILDTKNNRLHSEKGPAISFGDGVKVWALNGVSVASEIATTPGEKLDPHILAKVRNAEVRREIVNKIGIERVCNELNAIVVESGIDHNDMPCELLTLDIGDGRRRPYVKLRNPSVHGIYHIEGVHPGCRTLEEVWRFRNGSNEVPIILT